MTFVVLDFTIERLSGADLTDLTLSVNLSTGAGTDGAAFQPCLSNLDGFVLTSTPGSSQYAFASMRATPLAGAATVKGVIGSATIGRVTLSNAAVSDLELPARISFTTTTPDVDPARYDFTSTKGTNPPGGNVVPA